MTWNRVEKEITRNNKMCLALNVKFPIFLSDFNETWIFSTDFRKILKFHENLFSESRVVPCGRTDGRAGKHDEAISRFTQLRERAVYFYDS
jgi:hypothetical protein